MARPRKTDPSPLIRPLFREFGRKLAAALEQFTSGHVQRAVQAQSGQVRRRGRAAVSCFYPGCKNIAAPRFGMFCAALHKNLPQTQKLKYRSMRAAGQAVAARTARAGKGRGRGASAT